MRVLITGSNGFIGRYLCQRLSHEQGIQTLGIDRCEHRVPQNNISERNHSACNSFVRRDICDRQSLALDFEFFQPHVVMHLAARLGVENVMKNPGTTITENIVGTANVVELAQSYGAHVFFASTSDVYGHSKDLPFKEDGYSVIGPTHEPRWSYAISKLAGEHLTQAANGTILRFFNITGPGQEIHYVLPYFVTEALKGNNLVVYGDGSQTRCFTDVRDVVNVLVDFIDMVDNEEIAGETYNIGSRTEISMKNLAILIQWLVNPNVANWRDGFEMVKTKQPPHLYTEMPRRKPDMSKVEELLGWIPEISLEKTIQDTADYWRELLT